VKDANGGLISKLRMPHHAMMLAFRRPASVAEPVAASASRLDPRHRRVLRELRDDIAVPIQDVDAPPRDDEPHAFAVPGDVRHRVDQSGCPGFIVLAIQGGS
jgi:hypothetical protein